MPSTLTEYGLDQLSWEQRLILAEQLWDSVTQELDSSGLTAAQRQEIDRRLQLADDNPDRGQPWETVRDQILKRTVA
jgi:putative addiction module component (TIGR02574 family)